MPQIIATEGYMFEGAEHSENRTHKPSPPRLSLESRRSFLGGLLGLGSFLVGALLSVPLIRFSLFPLLRRTTDLKESTVGALTDFSSLTEPVMRTIQIEQVDGWRKAVSEKAVYVAKGTQGQLLVLTSICPHLGCNGAFLALVAVPRINNLRVLNTRDS